MKKRILAFLACIFLLSGCSASLQGEEKLQITASLFPQYDFARVICGDKADVSLLLPPGMDSHYYEPTPSDMIRISRSDLFLYTGNQMEPWAGRIAENVTGEVVDVSVGASLLSGTHMHTHSAQTQADLTTDPHIWTNPQNAIVMTENICKAVCASDPENAEFYTENATAYIAELVKLDADFKAVVDGGKRKSIIFGGHFAMRYFAEHYGLTYHAAFDACNGETEPSHSTDGARGRNPCLRDPCGILRGVIDPSHCLSPCRRNGLPDASASFLP